jgi:legumain
VIFFAYNSNNNRKKEMRSVLLVTLVAILVALFVVTEAQMEGKKWVLLVAGSKEYYNYRHQSDVYHAYQLYKKLGIPKEQLIVMHYDDIANNTQNPYPGTVINVPGGPNNYPGVPKDYTGEEVTPQNFLKILSGEDMGPGKKTIKSGPNDRIFVFFSDHGAPGLIAFPGMDALHAQDLINTIESMYMNKKYKEMVFYIEACESGSMFNGLLKNEWNVYATTAANPYESSYACYYSNVYNTYLADCYSVDYLEHTGSILDLTKVTLQEQFLYVKNEVNTSHVCQYGTKSISAEPLANFFLGRKQAAPQLVASSLPRADKLSSRKVKEDYLNRMIQKGGNTLVYQKALQEHKRQQLKASVVFGAFSHAFELHNVRAKIAAAQEEDHCYTPAINPSCNKAAIESMEKHCGKFNEANLEYASYLRDACLVTTAEKIDAKLRDICSVATL